MTAKLMSRDRDLIAILSSQINVLSFEQAMQGWWDRSEDPKGTVSRRLRTLDRDDHVHVFETVACLDPEFTDPILTWSPGDPSPSLERALEAASSRGAHDTVKRRLVTASRAKAALVVEGPPELASHELRLSALFLRARKVDPDEAQQWALAPGLSDPRYSRVFMGEGSDARCLEVARSSLAQSIEETLLDCRTRGAALEVW